MNIIYYEVVRELPFAKIDIKVILKKTLLNL
jgi:hypothetical protein